MSEARVAQVVVEAGGFTTRAALVEATSRAHVDAALASGEIVADARGRYVTRETDDAVRKAHASRPTRGSGTASVRR